MLRGGVAEETTKTVEAHGADGGSGKPRELPEPEVCLELLETMALIRRFEEEAGRQYQRAKAGGFLHLAIGEEATIVGTTSAMEESDYLIGTYRTHGHAIARGSGLQVAIALTALVGMGTKAGSIPFHSWLPRAHPIAPAPVSCCVTSATSRTVASQNGWRPFAGWK